MHQPRRPPFRQTFAEAIALLGPTPNLDIDDLLAIVPRGDRHAVLVLPALLRGDGYTTQAREFLSALGYSAHGWGLGLNIGPSKRLLEGAFDQLRELSDAHGPVSLVGFSMGGLFARWLSQQAPERVRQVITICSPIHNAAESFWLPLKPFLGLWPDVDVAKLADDVAHPLSVPLTCLVSPDDGIVHWVSCFDHQAAAEDVIEIPVPHALIVRSPEVMAIVAARLARAMPSRTSAPRPCATT
jgi:pimeloyl-ACP methyl ester carboxylesterase